MKPFIDILIPTYNRSEYLIANLNSIYRYIIDCKAKTLVRIIISDNCSDDNTSIRTLDFVKRNSEIQIKYFRNDKNIGLKNNILKTLSYANAKYIMFIGDDDFLSKEYWSFILSDFFRTCNIGLVVPSRNPRTPPLDLSYYYSTLEDVKFNTYNDSRFDIIRLSAMCNQLSGIVFYNDNLYEKTITTGIDNLYPFMALGAWGMHKRNGIEIINNPVLVTEGVQKDWGYGNDGLIIDIIDNVKYFSNRRTRYLNEALFTWIWRDRIEMNIVKANGFIEKGIKEVFSSKKILITTKLFYFLFLVVLFPKLYLLKKMNLLKSPHLITRK